MSRRIESHMIPGPAGRLEALLEEPEHTDPIEAALVCHPHPQHGGTMHNKVVYRLARGLRKTGAVVLRFNYRGVNLSQGEYDHGRGETEDARAALSWLRSRYPELPYTLAGFSFGSRIVLRLGGELPDVSRVIAVGYPTVYRERESLRQCKAPKVFIQSTHDEFGPKPELETALKEATPPVEMHWVEARDHFFAGALEEFEATVASLGSAGARRATP
ncbi:MAG: alpha/beta hydrolase [Bryobacteraceae bacterium]